jgi:hypothetical protein
LPIVSSHPAPAGSFTFISQMRGKEPATYTTAEILDLLNDELQTRSYLLIRKDKSLHLILADEKIDPGLVPHIELSDLPKRGRTEVVSIAVPLQKVGGAEGAKELTKLLGPFGNLLVMPEAKRVVVRDTAGNLGKIFKIMELDAKPAEKKAPPPKDAPKNDPDKSVLRFVFLEMIAHSDEKKLAVFRDRLTNETFRPIKGYVRFTLITDEGVKTEVALKIARIDPRIVYFHADKHVYAVRVGDTLADAMAKPLSADEVKKLNLPPAK